MDPVLLDLMTIQGNIGATECGLPFMEEEELIPTIANIARKSEVLSIRGCESLVLR